MPWRRAAPLMAAFLSTSTKRQNPKWFTIHHMKCFGIYHMKCFGMKCFGGSQWFQALAQKWSWRPFFGSLSLNWNLWICLAHLDSAPAAPSTIKTIQSVTPSVRSPPPAEDPSAVRVVLMECIPMPMIGTVMKSSVTRTEILLTHLARVLTARSSRYLLRQAICLTWRPRYASLRQLPHWLRKAFELTRLCYLVNVSSFTFSIKVAAGGRWSSTMSSRICTSWNFRLTAKQTTFHLKTCSWCFQNLGLAEKLVLTKCV